MQEFNAADIRIDMSEFEKKRNYSFGKVRQAEIQFRSYSFVELQLQIRFRYNIKYIH